MLAHPPPGTYTTNRKEGLGKCAKWVVRTNLWASSIPKLSRQYLYLQTVRDSQKESWAGLCLTGPCTCMFVQRVLLLVYSYWDAPDRATRAQSLYLFWPRDTWVIVWVYITPEAKRTHATNMHGPVDTTQHSHDAFTMMSTVHPCLPSLWAIMSLVYVVYMHWSSPVMVTVTILV